MTCNQFEEKHDTVNKSFEAFKTLLGKTVVGVFLLEENRNECMVSKLLKVRALSYCQVIFYCKIKI